MGFFFSGEVFGPVPLSIRVAARPLSGRSRTYQGKRSGRWKWAGVGFRSVVSQMPQRGASSRVQDQQSATTADPRANAVRRHVLPPVYVRPVDRSHQVGADPRLSQWKANPWWPRRQGILFLVRARSLSEFPGAALGVSRLARSSSVSWFVAGKLPPVLSAYPGCLSGRCIRLLILRFPSRVRVPPSLADYSCLLTRSAPGVCRCGRLWPAVNLVWAGVLLSVDLESFPLPDFLELTFHLQLIQELLPRPGVAILAAVHIEGVGHG